MKENEDRYKNPSDFYRKQVREMAKDFSPHKIKMLAAAALAAVDGDPHAMLIEGLLERMTEPELNALHNIARVMWES